MRVVHAIGSTPRVTRAHRDVDRVDDRRRHAQHHAGCAAARQARAAHGQARAHRTQHQRQQRGGRQPLVQEHGGQHRHEHRIQVQQQRHQAGRRVVQRGEERKRLAGVADAAHRRQPRHPRPRREADAPHAHHRRQRECRQAEAHRQQADRVGAGGIGIVGEDRHRAERSRGNGDQQHAEQLVGGASGQAGGGGGRSHEARGVRTPSWRARRPL